MKKPILVWDFDGVIFDSVEGVFQMTDQIFRSQGIEIQKETFLSFYEGNGWHKMQQHGATPDMCRLYDQLEADYFASDHNYLFFPGMKEVIHTLKDRYDSMITSNNVGPVIERALRTLEIRDAFFHIGGREEGGYKAERIRRNLEPLERSPEGLWFLTDTVGDINEGKELGMKTLAVTWGYHDKDRLQKANPDFLVDEPREILEILL